MCHRAPEGTDPLLHTHVDPGLVSLTRRGRRPLGCARVTQEALLVCSYKELGVGHSTSGHPPVTPDGPSEPGRVTPGPIVEEGGEPQPLVGGFWGPRGARVWLQSSGGHTSPGPTSPAAVARPTLTSLRPALPSEDPLQLGTFAC